MEKNTFLMINDMIYDLYSCTSLNEIKAKFLLRLKMVIPYSYASILLHETTEDPDTIRPPPQSASPKPSLKQKTNT